MKNISSAGVFFFVFCFLAITRAFAVSEPVDAIVTLSQSQLKAGDVLHLTASVRNMSDNEITLKFFVPYYTVPEIKNVTTGASAEMWAPPTDGPVQSATFVLKPNEKHDIASYTVEISEDPRQKMLANNGVSNRGWLKAAPGLYSIKFSLGFDSISGTSSKVVVTHMENFTIVTEDSLKNCEKKAIEAKVGMSRAEIEALMNRDGGISGIYKGERLFFTGLKPGEAGDKEWTKLQFCMLNIDFHPYGLSDSIYNDVKQFAEWVRTNSWHPDPKDVVVKVSSPFIDYQHFD